jgi:hypothetical protein
LRDDAIALMAWGMSYQDYWHGDLEIADYYIEAAAKRQEEELIMQDVIAYRQGIYNLIAIKHVMSQGKVKFPQKPFGMEFERKDESELSIFELQAKCDNAILAMISKVEVIGGDGDG